MKFISQLPKFELSLKLVALILLLVISGVYLNSINNPFYFDDYRHIKDNVRDYRLSNLSYLFNKHKYYEVFGTPAYRPVEIIFLYAFYQVCGETPGNWRLINLIFHTANCFLLYIIFCRFGLSAQFSLLATLIFAVHTVNTEVINIVSYHNIIIGAFFFLLAFLFYFKEGVFWRALSIVLYFLSAFIKELYLLLPFVFFLFTYGQKEKKFNWLSFIRNQVGYLIAAGLFLFISFYLMSNPQKSFEATFQGSRLISALLTFSVVVSYYVKILFVPTGLTPIYGFPVYSNILDWRVAASVTFLLLFIGFILHALYHRKAYAPYLAWFFLFLLPTANIIPIWAVLAERFLYFPLIGFFPGILLLAKAVLIKLGLSGQRPIQIGGVLFIIILCAFTIQRNAVWQDPVKLWEDVARKVPHSSGVRLNLGLEYYKEKRYDEAILQYKLAIEADPAYVNPYSSLGRLYLELGRYEEAIEYINKALVRKDGYFSQGNHYDDLLNLGGIYFRLKNYPEAIEYWKTAQEVLPSHPDSYFNLALAYEKQGLKKEADQARQISRKLASK